MFEVDAIALVAGERRRCDLQDPEATVQAELFSVELASEGRVAWAFEKCISVGCRHEYEMAVGPASAGAIAVRRIVPGTRSGGVDLCVVACAAF